MLPKFIVDARLPKQLSDYLIDLGFDSLHTLELPDKNFTTDKTIIQIADLEKRIVITKDADFLESHMVKNEPGKLLLIKTGNIPNAALLEIFKNHISNIAEIFITGSYIEMTNSEIVVHR